MSVKTTIKDIKRSYIHQVIIPYGKLQSALRYIGVSAHTERAEGWGADIYHFGDSCIVTGYKPFGDIEVSYKEASNFEKDMELIINRLQRCDAYSYNDIATEVYKQLLMFIDRVIKKGGKVQD